MARKLDSYVVVYGVKDSDRLHETLPVPLNDARSIKNILSQKDGVSAWIEDRDLSIVEV